MYVNGAKRFSLATQSVYEGPCRDAIQDFLESRGMTFDIRARDQIEKYDEMDFYCYNSIGEKLRFEVESREQDLSVMTAGWFNKQFRQNTVHILLRKHLSLADFFVSYCTENHDRADECLFVVEAFDVFTSKPKVVHCDNKNYQGDDLVFNVPITKGARFVRRYGQWIATTKEKLDKWNRRSADGSFIFRLRKDDWRNSPVIRKNLALAHKTCVAGV